MPARPGDPLAETDRVLIDGTNVLHRLASAGGAAPPAALVGRLRGIVPATVAIELIFDGPAERGRRGERIAAGTTVRVGGPRSADAVIVGLVKDARRSIGPEGTARLLVVTDDRELRHGVQVRGARTAGVAWLLSRLTGARPGSGGRLSSASIGNPRPPRPIPSEAADDGDRPGWQPGRGATTKRGNPRRTPRAGRTGRMRP